MSGRLWNNPVLLRELQERVLSKRTVIIITLWVGVLCLTTGLYYASEATGSLRSEFDQFGNNVLRLASIGQNMFDWMLFFMVGLVLFLVPGVTAASIAGERERQTLLPMQVTLLRPMDIVVGKIAASLVFVLVLIAVSSPVLAFAYVIGGVTIGEVFASLAMLVFEATAIACLTVACSAFVRRVPAAIVTAYGVVLVLAVGSLAAYGVASVVDENRGFDQDRPPLAMLAINPVVAVAEVGDTTNTDNEFFFVPVDTPMGALRELVADNRRRRAQVFPGPFGDDFFVIEDIPAPAFPVPPPILLPTPTSEPPADAVDADGEETEGAAALDAVEPGAASVDFDEVDAARAEAGDLLAPPDVPTPTPLAPDQVAALEAAQAAAEAAAAEADAAFAVAQEVPAVEVAAFQPDAPPQPDPGLSFVQQHIIAMTALSLAAVWLAARRVRTPAEVER